MITILDTDSIIYSSCCVLAEDEPVEYALSNVKKALLRVKEGTEAEQLIPVVSGKGNFREDIYPEYKANRKNQPRPPYLKEARQYVIDHWEGMYVDGLEADDVCGIMLYTMQQGEERVTLSHIDKDLDMLEGHHHNYKTSEQYYINDVEANRKFFTQMLTGDSTDNIPGMFKLVKKKAMPKVKAPLNDMDSVEDMYEHVLNTYKEACKDAEQWEGVEKQLAITAQLLWIKRDAEEPSLWCQQRQS